MAQKEVYLADIQARELSVDPYTVELSDRRRLALTAAERNLGEAQGLLVAGS